MDKFREEFEKWWGAFVTLVETPRAIYTNTDGMDDSEIALSAWQAATEASDAKWQARVMELEEAIRRRLNADKYCAQYAHLPDSEEDRAQACQDADDALIKALSNTSTGKALQRIVLDARIDEQHTSIGMTNAEKAERVLVLRKQREGLVKQDNGG